jgi:transaldolase
MNKSPLTQLPGFGQSPWLDFIQRGLLESGELGRMIERWGLRGITSNPAIFEQAISQTHDYDGDIARLAKLGKNAVEIYETLTLADVRAAADLFLPVFEESRGTDGFVSLEVSPHLARDADGTTAEARRLWTALDRPNVMIKVPGTPAGLAAIRALLSEGINVNVTLLFSVARYREVLDAYVDGLEAADTAGRPVESIASVASFFLSRIDTAVDEALEPIAVAGGAQGAAAKELLGEAAIASARSAYHDYERHTSSGRWRALAARGAQPQRLLWASTGTKNPRYSDTKYVEPLIGPHTVNTLPLATLEAYHEHGRPAQRLAGTGEAARQTLDTLARLGVDLNRVTADLLEQGIRKFVEPYDRLLESIDAQRAAVLAQSGRPAGNDGDVSPR